MVNDELHATSSHALAELYVIQKYYYKKLYPVPLCGVLKKTSLGPIEFNQFSRGSIHFTKSLASLI